VSEPTDPKRLADADPSSRLGRIMTSATRDVPSEEQLAALAERLGSVLGPTQGTPRPRGDSTLAKLAVATGVAVIIAGAAVALRTRSLPQPSQSSIVSAAPPAAVPSPTASSDTPADATPAPALGAPALMPSASSRALLLPNKQLGVEAAKSTTAAADGASESRLLEQARRALPSDPPAALALTNQDAVLFPHGVLVQEREVIAIEALRRLNRRAEADRRAEAFSKAFPGSAHQRVIEDASPK
jgi:hypothetical protein